jgi:hypothetical protein
MCNQPEYMSIHTLGGQEMALNDNLSGGIREYREHEQRSLGMGVPRYTDDSPKDYVPDVSFVDMRGIEYEPYEVVFEQAPPHTPHVTGALLHDMDEPPVHYSDCPMTQGLFEHLMKEESLDPTGRLDMEQISGTPVDPGPMLAASSLEEIVQAAPIEDSAPQVRFPRQPIAGRGQYDHFDRLPALVDYAAVDPHDFFEQQRRILHNGFGPLEAVPLDRGAPMEMDFLDQIVLSDPSQQMLLFPEPHMPRHMGPGFGPDVPPAL